MTSCSLKLPVSHRKTHRVSDQNDSYYRRSAQFAVAIDTVAERQLKPKNVRERNHTHSDYQTEPLDLMRCPNPPENQTSRNEYD